MSYYFEGRDGREHCYDSIASYVCELADTTSAAYSTIAEQLNGLGLDGARVLRGTHRGSSAGIADGKCGRCGTAARRLGYRAWTAEPNTDEHRQRIADRLGMGAPMRIVASHYFATKHEAIAWCREQAEVDRMVAS